ncbi:MAG: YqeG family HAD IIIA-type phosphatase [Syntrophomonadaceae bacterium]|jgi:HAD superfamily phosphatase (TIGR01668 family)|nr:YqeG family HAD IIIA-type phosphatase [Syntrophomonadaceae bacterium]
MLKILYPNLYVDSLRDIPLEDLKQAGKKAFVLDLDNTVTEWNSNEIREEVSQWFLSVRQHGFKACIISNNGEKRVETVARSLDIPFISRAGKPRRGSFRKALILMNTAAEETAVIGDQIFTDIMGGNRAGLFTILVVPIASREFFGTKISRLFEYFVLKHIKKNLGIDDKNLED